MDDDDVLRIARAPTNSADLLGALSKVDSELLEIEEISVSNLEEGFEMLDDGTVDLVLGAAIDISKSDLLGDDFKVETGILYW